MHGTLTICRHGQSRGNREGLFTGWLDADLTEEGIAEARLAGRMLRARAIVPDICFTSCRIRARRTLQLMLGEMAIPDAAIVEDSALNERHYGDLTGLSRSEAVLRWGREQVEIWRRSFDVAPPGGESLSDTAARVVPFYTKHIAPRVRAGGSVLVVAHGNSLRALVMHIERLDRHEITRREIPTGKPLVYLIDADGHGLKAEAI